MIFKWDALFCLALASFIGVGIGLLFYMSEVVLACTVIGVLVLIMRNVSYNKKRGIKNEQ